MDIILRCPACQHGPVITRTSSGGDAEKRYEFYRIQHRDVECVAKESFNEQVNLEFNSMSNAVLYWNHVIELNQYTLGE